MARGSTAAMQLVVNLDDKASKGLDRIGKESKGLGGILGGVGLGIGASIIPMIGNLASGLVDAGKAAMEEKAGIDRLNASLKNSIPGWDGNTAAIEQYISKSEQMAFADDQLRDSLNLLVTQTGDLAEAQALQTTAMDLARFGNIDLEKATRLMLKADDESFAALGKLGIQIDKTATKEEALAQIRAQTSGQAELYANSAAGSMEKLQNAWGNALEDIGGVIMPKVTEALGGVADFVSSPEFQQGFNIAIDLISNGLGQAFTFIGQVIDTVRPIVEPFLQSFATLIGDITAGGDPFQAIGDHLGRIGPLIGDGLGQAIEWIGTEGLPMLVGKLGEWGTALWNWITPMIGPALEALGGFIGSVIQWIIDNGPAILEQLGVWAQAFLDWIGRDVVPFIGEKLEELGTAIEGWFTGGGWDALVSNLQIWAQAILDWIGRDVLPFLGEKLGQLGEFIWNWITGGGLQGLIDNLVLWGGAILGWLQKDVIPFLGDKLQELGEFIWNWITGGGLSSLIENLVTWGGAFLGFIQKDVLPLIGQKLQEFGQAVWNWLTGGGLADTVANLQRFAQSFLDWIGKDVLPFIGTKLKEFGEAIWNWLTGGGLTDAIANLQKFAQAFLDWVGKDVIPFIGGKLGEFGTAIWGWITQAAKDALTKAAEIGKELLNGIMNGLKGAYDKISGFIMGIAQQVWNNVVNFFTGGANAQKQKIDQSGGGGGGADSIQGDAIIGAIGNGSNFGLPSNRPIFTPRSSSRGGFNININVNAGLGANGTLIGQEVAAEVSRVLRTHSNLVGGLGRL